MKKLVVTAKDAQGKAVFTGKIEGQVAANRKFNELKARADVRSLQMTYYQVAFGSTVVEKTFTR